jgi:hypothetical protein
LTLADYELVRIYHPDSSIARAYPPEISEARFRAISTSYDVLRGRHATYDPDSPDASPQHRVDLHALWRAKQRLRQDPLEPVDDRWKDGIIIGSLILVRNLYSAVGLGMKGEVKWGAQALGAFVYQVVASRQKMMQDALRSPKRSGTGRAGLRRASEESHDVRLLTDPNSDSPDDTPSPLR